MLIMNPLKHLFFSTIFMSAVFCFTLQVKSVPVVFTVDSSQSQIAAGGTVAGSSFSAQGAGALTTSYSGTINANLSNSSIQFTDGSTIVAANSGTWQPASGGTSGSAPANYGAKASIYGVITVYGALRNIALDVTSPAITITNGGFSSSGLVCSFINGGAILDYYSSIESGSQTLDNVFTNTVATPATLSTNAGVRTLVIPIDTQFSLTLLSTDDSTVHLAGQIVATNSVAAAIPVIHSLSVTNQSIMVAAENATAESQLLVSTNLIDWTPATATTTTNDSGWIIFEAPMDGPRAFYRVQQ